MRTIFFTLILSFAGLYADPRIPETFFQKKIDLEPQEDELVAVERMIELTGRQQEAQIRIKNLIMQLRHNKEMFMKNEDSKLHARYLVETAAEILTLVQTYHLEHLFSSDFMEDLAVYAQRGRRE